ncbi:MAG TPA: Uma2 family endonuclease [Schlesneria sp.]|jgi:Uma2 family endonuclease
MLIQVPALFPRLRFWRFSLDQYHAMIDRGILQSDDPIEFLEGVLVPKLTRNPLHRIALAHLRDTLQGLVSVGWHLESQEAITLETSEPEPDLAIVRGQVDDYPDRHPGSGDLAFVAEVSDSTLVSDRTLKKRIYAQAGIIEYWIVNLVERQIEVYSDPTGPLTQPEYRVRRVFTAGQTIPVAVGGVEIGFVAVSRILP